MTTTLTNPTTMKVHPEVRLPDGTTTTLHIMPHGTVKLEAGTMLTPSAKQKYPTLTLRNVKPK